MAILKAINISKQYANHKALSDLCMEVEQGCIFGLLGPNGAGKTTLIRIINQITAPDTGELWFNNRKIDRSDIVNIGYLPEERGLYKKMTVGEQSVYLARLKGISRVDAIRKLKFWFNKFDILPWWDKKVEELSKGMQQKVQFIVTILHDPALLIFDEPFSGFDPINANLLKNEILELKRKGATIIFSTHNMGSVEAICDHIALINKSKKILDGKVSDIKNQHKTETYECVYTGNKATVEAILGQNYNLLSHTSDRHQHHLKFKTQYSGQENDFIKLMANNVHLVSFNEVIPSMEDIFIKVVQQAYQN
jgi:ABC-2 type transport system ATP-binding protein